MTGVQTCALPILLSQRFAGHTGSASTYFSPYFGVGMLDTASSSSSGGTSMTTYTMSVVGLRLTNLKVGSSEYSQEKKGFLLPIVILPKSNYDIDAFRYHNNKMMVCCQ